MATALPSYEEAAAVVAREAMKLSRTGRKREWVRLAQAAGRVLAEPLIADTDQPPFARSTRDGYACRAEGASVHGWLAIVGSRRAGETPAEPLTAGTALEIMTGAPVPEGADAVAMFEHVEAVGKRVRLLPPRILQPGENVVARGAQARAGDELLAAGTRVTWAQIALAAACGYAEVEVYARPRVAILATGDELAPIEAKPGPGQIRNSNASMLAAMVEAAGGEAWVMPTAADNRAALERSLAEAMPADMLLVTGGVSAGKFDLVEPALERVGAQFHFTGARIQPGKPIVFGELPEGGRCRVPFFGLPGNPVSSAVTFLLFAAPVLEALAGCRRTGPRFAQARMSAEADRHGRAGLTRFLPAYCTFACREGETPDAPAIQVSFVPWQGSGDLVALARSNCFLVIPEEATGLEPGAAVRILLP